jgi:cyclopropane fatty-acyl-phospholipid synthase-like methyltransferase
MVTAFDHIATSYDESFTNTLVGAAQRELVWNYLEKLLMHQSGAKVLELNCGTGEDAKWMAEHGANVLATDISSKMVQLSKHKIGMNGLMQKVECKQMDLNNIEQVIGMEKFDIIFSNFGGLNCIDPESLDNLLQYQLPSLLNKNGKMVFVIMPTFCLWESFYHALIFKRKNIFRRFSSKPLNASLGNGETLQAWYYSPSWIKKHLPGNIQLQSMKPIGFFVPPSYLNHFFSKRPRLLGMLKTMETKVAGIKFLAAASDHYLVHLQKTEG